MVGEDGSVTIEVAAELMNIEVGAIREWSAIGSLQIERQGDSEMVHLNEVKALVRSPVASGEPMEPRRAALLDLLRETTTADAGSVVGLQELARERSTRGN